MPGRKRKVKDVSEGKKYEQEYESCSCEELRHKLLELGENPGPIDASNKYIHMNTPLFLSHARFKC